METAKRGFKSVDEMINYRYKTAANTIESVNGIYNRMKCHPIMKEKVTPAVTTILSIFPWPVFFGFPFGLVIQWCFWFVLDPLLLLCPCTCPFEFTWLFFI